MHRKVIFLIIALMSLSLISWTQIQTRYIVRVGVYENSPKIYTDTDGRASGFWPEIIRYIAQKENWEIEWVYGTWEENTQRLATNEIDILPDVGWTEQRSQQYDFSSETVLVSWARVYVPKGSSIETILDLDGKRIAGLNGSLNFDGPEGIKALTEKFNVQCTFVGMNSYLEVFDALENGEVDGGITNKDFGNLNEENYDVERTPIIIQPTSIKFAFTKGADFTPYLINAVDSNIGELKDDPNSIYYQALDLYLGEKSQRTFIEIIPSWVYILLISGGISILFLLVISVSARKQVQQQTSELRASESRYRALFENNPDQIFRLKEDGTFLDYHASPDNKTYLLNGDFLGKNIKEVIPPDLSKVILNNVEKVIKSNSNKTHEFQIPVQNGHRDFEARYTASGENEVITIIRDITARKKAEMELRESEKRYQTLARVSPVGIFHTNNEGLTTYVNPTWCQISGVPADEALGVVWLNAVHPEDRDTLYNNWKKTTQVRTSSTAEFRFVHPDGSVVWVIGQAVPEINSKKQVDGYVGTITDITERKKIEAELERSIDSERAALAVARMIQAANLALSRSLNLEEILQLLLDHLFEIVPFDVASVMLLEENQKLTTYALKGSEEWIDTDQSHLISIDKNNIPVLDKILESGQCICIEDTNRCDEWQDLPGMGGCESWIGVPLIAGHQMLGLYSLGKKTLNFFTPEYQELTKAISAQAAIAIQNAKLHESILFQAAELEKRVADRTIELAQRVSEVESLNSKLQTLTEELKEAVVKAESADKLKSAFLATMSHELRTPLNSIIGFTGILLQKLVGPLSDEQEKQLKMVQGSARHLLELINDVLDISKIEAGQVKVVFDVFNLDDVIEKSIQKVSTMADKKGLALIINANPKDINIESDKRRIEQILINLLNNAVKFTEQGEVRLECRLSDDMLITEVIDTGIGIKLDDIESLFKPFQQIDTGITRQYEGTGLGLSICRRLVELLGGKIWVESEWGKGSTFTFTLPLKRTIQQ